MGEVGARPPWTPELGAAAPSRQKLGEPGAWKVVAGAGMTNERHPTEPEVKARPPSKEWTVRMPEGH